MDSNFAPLPRQVFLASPTPSALWTFFSVDQNGKLEIEENTRPEELMEIVTEGVKETTFFKNIPYDSDFLQVPRVDPCQMRREHTK